MPPRPRPCCGAGAGAGAAAGVCAGAACAWAAWPWRPCAQRMVEETKQRESKHSLIIYAREVCCGYAFLAAVPCSGSGLFAQTPRAGDSRDRRAGIRFRLSDRADGVHAPRHAVLKRFYAPAGVSQRHVSSGDPAECRYAVFIGVARLVEGAGAAATSRYARPLLPDADDGRVDGNLRGAGRAHHGNGRGMGCDHRAELEGHASREGAADRCADQHGMGAGTNADQ